MRYINTSIVYRLTLPNSVLTYVTIPLVNLLRNMVTRARESYGLGM